MTPFEAWIPPWPRRCSLTPEKEQILARETSERPLHGVPSVYREPDLESLNRHYNAYLWGVHVPSGGPPHELTAYDGRLSLIWENLAALADVISFYTRKHRFDKWRTLHILSILHVAERAHNWHAPDYGTRAWMHRVCQEVRKR